ncbi:MAG: macro domain-containing protein [Brumimicrobium sp.]|nr:macro domain-containing protein [Brumimicrobium sp.]
MEVTKNGVKITITRGDITDQSDADAIVNAANAQLKSGGGVAGAIHSAAGPALEAESTKKAPIKPGEAVITGAYNLENKYIIHCLGPVYGEDDPSDELLANCYLNALDLAEQKDIEIIAFPSISTGAFGYPIEEAAEVAIKAIKNKVQELETMKEIRMVLYHDRDVRVYENALRNIYGD